MSHLTDGERKKLWTLSQEAKRLPTLYNCMAFRPQNTTFTQARSEFRFGRKGRSHAAHSASRTECTKLPLEEGNSVPDQSHNGV
jgi:hypothetical protein